MQTFSETQLDEVLERLRDSPLALRVGVPRVQGPTCHLDLETWELLLRVSSHREYANSIIQGFLTLKDRMTADDLGLASLEVRRLRTRRGKHMIRPSMHQDQAEELKRISEVVGLSPSQTLEAFAFLYFRSIDPQC